VKFSCSFSSKHEVAHAFEMNMLQLSLIHCIDLLLVLLIHHALYGYLPVFNIQQPLRTLANERVESENSYPRDIGRSTQFSNGHVVIQFGDTFDEKGRFLAATANIRTRELPTSNMRRNRWNLDNTCAVVVDPNNPTVSRYNLNVLGKVGEFIEQLPKDFPPFTRNKLWSFSGIVETGSDVNGIIHGYTWFRAERMSGADTGFLELASGSLAGSSQHFVKETGYIQMGVAKVEYNPWKRDIKALRTELEAKTFTNVSFQLQYLRPDRRQGRKQLT
jgi:hypothetical protein